MRIEQTSGPWDQVALAILRTRFFLLMRQLYAAIPLGPEVRLGVNRIKRRLIRKKGPLGALTQEVERLLSSRPDTAMLLVAEERIRGALASGELGNVNASAPKPKAVQQVQPRHQRQGSSGGARQVSLWIFLRHGESEANRVASSPGHQDVALTALGEEQPERPDSSLPICLRCSMC